MRLVVVASQIFEITQYYDKNRLIAVQGHPRSSIRYAIRYGTIGEFNVDSKPEYTA